MKLDAELERFKTQINLVEYAQAQGYEIDKSQTSQASTAMRLGEDKIIVATGKDGHGVYFSVRDDRDNGSVIDFVQKRQDLNLGQVRKELRPWCDGPTPSSYCPNPNRKPAAERPKKPRPSSQDQQQVMAAWIKMAMVEHGQHPYLVKQRAIDPKVLAEERFQGRVKMDTQGNAAFPHFNHEGLCGYELKNHQFTGFSKHGQKGLWFSTNLRRASKIVVVESALDAVSHAQLTRDKDVAYVSLSGQPSESQLQLFKEMAEEVAERQASIILATDNDPAGHNLAQQLQTLTPAGAQVERQTPPQGKDWNEQLQLKTKAHSKSSLSLSM